MSDDSPATPTRKSKTRRWLAFAIAAFLAWFLWQLFGPTPPIIVSKETTYITEPLLPNGLPDYRKYFEQRLRDGVTLENNAAVLMWQAIGPGRDASALQPADWKRIVQDFKLPKLDDSKFLVEPDSEPVAERAAQWLFENAPAWKQALENPPAIQDGDALPSDAGDRLIFAAMEAPWRRTELPPLAEWVDANNQAIDLLVEAAKRPRFYTPFESPDPGDDEYLHTTVPIRGMIATREAARALQVRAMLELGEDRHAEAWQDLLAMHRWARLVAQGSTVVDQLIATAIDGIACSADAVLLGSDDLPLDVAQQIQTDLQNLTPAADLAKSFDFGERLYFLDATVAYRSKGIGALRNDAEFPALLLDEQASPTLVDRVLNQVSADWNVGLVDGNHMFDRLAAAARLHSYAERNREFDLAESLIPYRKTSLTEPSYQIAAAFYKPLRNRMLSSTLLNTCTPATHALLEAVDRGQANLELTRLAAALAVYRAEHGEYPNRLDDLVPAILPKLPTDFFHDKPYIYRREADGYLLYTCGPNGKDDGGSGQFSNKLAGRPIYDMPPDEQAAAQEKIPGSADDISLRLPKPPFTLPKPPTAQ